MADSLRCGETISRAVGELNQQRCAAIKEKPVTLTTLNEPGVELGGGIRWMMMDGILRVPCWVTGEALDDIEGGNASQRERTARFERHRSKIEQLASQKYLAGEKRPIVMTFDLRR
jgi:hypothetical protein